MIRRKWPNRPMHEPGTRFKYNDVRINLLAYALLQVFSRTAAGGAARSDHGTDRGVEHLALARLPKFLGRAGWAADAVGIRRRPFWRRDVHQQPPIMPASVC